MKKLTFAVAAVLGLGAAASAQKIGVHANGIIASQNLSYENFSIKSDSRFSWKAGLMGELPLGGGLKLMPQVNLLSKGGKFNEEGETLTFQLTYVEVPVLLTYNVSRFFVGAGPTVSFGVGGKMKYSNGMESGSVDIKFDGDEDSPDEMAHLKRTELGLQFIGGVNLPKGFVANLHYNLGLSGIQPGNNDEGQIKNRYFGFGIGKYF